MPASKNPSDGFNEDSTADDENDYLGVAGEYQNAAYEITKPMATDAGDDEVAAELEQRQADFEERVVGGTHKLGVPHPNEGASESDEGDDDEPQEPAPPPVVE